MKPGPTLHAHVLEALPAYGAVCVETEGGVFEALLPQDMAARLERPEHWRFTFDPEAAAEDRGADLLVFGNPVLARFLDYGVGVGAACRAYIPGLYVDNPAAGRLAAEALSVHGADLVLRATRVRNVRFARFLFQVSFMSDAREEDLCSAVVDMSTGSAARRLEGLLAAKSLEPRPERPFPEVPAIPWAQAYGKARAEALGRLATSRGALLRDQERRRGEEERRLLAFHEGYREEQHDLMARYRRQPERVAAIEAKIHAGRLECECRIAELPRKYALRTELRLRGLLSVVHPMVYADCEVLRDHKVVGHLSPRWNPLDRSAEPAPCPACGGLSYEYTVKTGPRETQPLLCRRCRPRAGDEVP
ncbi:MAG: hypothetical protein HY922_17370 [Elusimicrobia bacterium]|nr:hypothetical protein [Elusimicrobiota bacterium]